MRQTTGAMICPSCGKLISVSEERCPFCGAWRPGMFGYAPALRRVLGDFDFPRLVMVACVTLYVLALALQPSAILERLFAPGDLALWELGMTGGPAWRNGWWWTLFTANFLHGNVLHILFNMLSLYNLGPSVMRGYGSARGFVLYMVAGVAGFLLSNVISAHPSVGASASIYGLLAALIVYGRRHGHSEMTNQLWVWAVLMFAMGFGMRGVNNWAHAGGFAGGWIVAQVMPTHRGTRESLQVQLLAVALIAVTLVGFVLSFVNVRAQLER